MVEYISGTVKAYQDGMLVLEVGVLALNIHVCQKSIFTADERVLLYIHLHWNQENGPNLYGFSNQLEKKIFNLVLSCAGAGPKIALAVLSDLGAEQFLEAVQAADDKALSSVSGIGPKKAEQMIVHLKHKIAKLTQSELSITGAMTVKWHEITQVLESLHYTHAEVTRALHYLRTEHAAKEIPLDGLIRHALSFLAKKR